MRIKYLPGIIAVLIMLLMTMLFACSKKGTYEDKVPTVGEYEAVLEYTTDEGITKFDVEYSKDSHSWCPASTVYPKPGITSYVIPLQVQTGQTLMWRIRIYYESGALEVSKIQMFKH